MRILANDGIDAAGKKMLEETGFEVVTAKIAQEELPIKLNAFDGIIVRSATKVRQSLIEKCPNLKFIGRAGVGMDNIDVDFARSKGIEVINTPAASSISVAELVFAHLFSLCRSVHLANRQMPTHGISEFNKLKKAYAEGIELFGKTLGIIGYGRIGQEVGRIAKGIGMQVVVYDVLYSTAEMATKIENLHGVKVGSFQEVVAQSDFVSIHTPGLKQALFTEEVIHNMKTGAGIMNCSRGGIIDEEALIKALDSGKLRFAGLDVFANEPEPDARLLNHPKISVSPHIGASTEEAQERIGLEMAGRIIELFHS
jgi:D-3-phosphoglycerate dehydrogenase / 2-oxoglutarate reductase